MTDEQIIKAADIFRTGKCNGCPYHGLYTAGCVTELIKDVFGFINRQKEENKELRSDKIIAERHEKDARELFVDCKRQLEEAKAEIERLNKNYEELIYKTECLLCHATGNKFSKYTYTTQEMLSFVDDYIQDCCDEAIEETKVTAKSEAIKEFCEKRGIKYVEDDV